MNYCATIRKSFSAFRMLFPGGLKLTLFLRFCLCFFLVNKMSNEHPMILYACSNYTDTDEWCRKWVRRTQQCLRDYKVHDWFISINTPNKGIIRTCKRPKCVRNDSYMDSVNVPKPNENHPLQRNGDGNIKCCVAQAMTSKKIGSLRRRSEAKNFAFYTQDNMLSQRT